MAAGHQKKAAGFEKPDFFLLGNKARKLHLPSQTECVDLRLQSFFYVTDENGPKTVQAPGKIRKRSQQIIDPFLSMHATDPDDIVDFLLCGHRLGFFDLQAVRDVREFVFRTAELEQAGAHGGMEIEEVDLNELLTPALSSRGGEGGDSAALVAIIPLRCGILLTPAVTG